MGSLAPFWVSQWRHISRSRSSIRCSAIELILSEVAITHNNWGRHDGGFHIWRPQRRGKCSKLADKQYWFCGQRRYQRIPNFWTSYMMVPLIHVRRLYTKSQPEKTRPRNPRENSVVHLWSIGPKPRPISENANLHAADPVIWKMDLKVWNNRLVGAGINHSVLELFHSWVTRESQPSTWETCKNGKNVNNSWTHLLHRHLYLHSEASAKSRCFVFFL